MGLRGGQGALHGPECSQEGSVFAGISLVVPHHRSAEGYERDVPPPWGLAATLAPCLFCSGPYHVQQCNLGSLSKAAYQQHLQTLPICPSFIPWQFGQLVRKKGAPNAFRA